MKTSLLALSASLQLAMIAPAFSDTHPERDVVSTPNFPSKERSQAAATSNNDQISRDGTCVPTGENCEYNRNCCLGVCSYAPAEYLRCVGPSF